MAVMAGLLAPSLKTRCCGFSETRDTLREAFRQELIQDGESWTLMIQDRNLTSHTYNRATADAIAANIQKHYLGCFQSLRTRLQIRLEQFEC